MACRVYHTLEGGQGWPTKEMIRSALVAAR